ncbi:MAG: LLM class flavin-dependent oxidoreductase [Chloroflexota bacterium]
MKIGTVVRLGPVPEGGQPPSFASIRNMALRMEKAGLDSVWVYDHLLYRWPGKPTDGIWECWTVLSALAASTQRVELGTLVACTQFRNPALLAKMAATLDEVSGGRFTLGVGAGWHQPEFDAFGFPFDHRVSRFEEVLQIIGPLLRTGKVNFSGRFYTAANCELVPRTTRADGVPMMVAGHGPRMLGLVARHADAWNTAWHSTPAEAEASLGPFRQACAEADRDPSSVTLTVSVPVSYPDLGSPGGRRRYLSGSSDEVADALHGFEAVGAQHLMVEFWPYTSEALERFARAVEAYRSGSVRRGG